jgi:sugar lactone lactonase YvrE
MKNSVRLALCALVCLIFGSVGVEAQVISTIAGGGPVGLTANAASVGSPVAVRFDTAGNMFVLDNKYSRVLKVNAAGQMSVYAGNGTTGFSGDGLVATNGQMNGPSGMCIQPTTNNLFIADSDNNVIREVTATDGIMHTFAGVPTTNPSFGGDGGVATNAHFHFPDGCAFDSHGNLYVADRGNNEVRVVVATAGTPFAGTVVGSIYNFVGAGGAGPASPAFGFSPDGTAAQGALINGPFDVAVDASDNVFFADLGNNFNPDGTPGTSPANNNVIRVVLAVGSTVHTVAGKVGVYGADNNMLATTAAINQPKGLSFDAAGNLYFCDTVNQVIRKVAPSIAGNISVVAGTLGHSGFSGDGHAATSATLSFPAGTTIDATGNLFIADEDSNALRVVPSAAYTAFGSTVAQGNIGTLAGNGHASFGGNGSLSIDGELNTPAGLAVDPSKNLIIAESNNDVIREISAQTAFLSTIAGQPENNGFLNGALGVNAINGALSVATDASGAVYVADTANCLVRKIGAGGVTTTIAGTEPTNINPDNPIANHPVCGFTASGGAAVGTLIGQVQGIALDSHGNVFFSDSTNNVIWEVPVAASGTLLANHAYAVVGIQSTTGAFAGEGGPVAQAKLSSPMGIFIDIYDNLFIADAGNHRIREVPTLNIGSMVPGSIYTIAGTGTSGITGDTGLATSAEIQFPFAVFVDHAENVFFSDSTLTLAAGPTFASSSQTIREISGTTGIIHTVAGITSTAGFSGDSGAATSAHLDFPMGLALTPNGPPPNTTANLLISDSVNNRVRSVAGIADITPKAVVSFTPNPVVFTSEPMGTASAPVAITLTNTGGAALTVNSFSFGGADASDFTQGTTTCTGTPIITNGTCTVNVVFTPGALGTREGTIIVASNAFASPVATLTGTGGTPTADLNPTSLAFPSTAVGKTSAAQTITLTNNGNAATLVNGAAISGTNAADFKVATNTCGIVGGILPTMNCTISVTYTPSTGNAESATLTITDNVGTGSQTVALTSAASTLSLTVTDSDPSSTQTVAAGAAATYNLSVTGNQAVTATITCTGAPTAATCTPAPASIALTAGTAGAFKVTVSTTARGAIMPFNQPSTKMQPPTFLQIAPLASLALLFVIAMMLGSMQTQAGRMRTLRVAMSLCLILMPIAAATVLVGCGGGSSSTTPPPATGTPAGTYTLTVTATSGTTTASTTVTLVVN